eukprot:3939020-Rhodomonas_salina.1
MQIATSKATLAPCRHFVCCARHASLHCHPGSTMSYVSPEHSKARKQVAELTIQQRLSSHERDRHEHLVVGMCPGGGDVLNITTPNETTGTLHLRFRVSVCPQLKAA